MYQAFVADPAALAAFKTVSGTDLTKDNVYT